MYHEINSLRFFRDDKFSTHTNEKQNAFPFIPHRKKTPPTQLIYYFIQNDKFE